MILEYIDRTRKDTPSGTVCQFINSEKVICWLSLAGKFIYVPAYIPL